MTTRHYTPIDALLINIDQALRTLFGQPTTTGRPHPAAETPPTELPPAEQIQTARLMRVNHTGEVCAQALYQGQALTARLETVRERMEQAAGEENDHLVWCRIRLQELGSHTSRLNPLFYAGAFALGALAGKAGDRWSLGFVAETEHQVVEAGTFSGLKSVLHTYKNYKVRSAIQVYIGQRAEASVWNSGAWYLVSNGPFYDFSKNEASNAAGFRHNAGAKFQYLSRKV